MNIYMYINLKFMLELMRELEINTQNPYANHATPFAENTPLTAPSKPVGVFR